VARWRDGETARRRSAEAAGEARRREGETRKHASKLKRV
jgi:hypothetical protein